MGKFIDLTGQKFGKLTVLSYIGSKKYNCICDCGIVKIVRKGNLLNGSTNSCGKHRYTNIAGQQFGKLTAIEYVGNRRWNCRCECGNEKIRGTQDLTEGISKSCGCVNPIHHIDLTGQKFGKLTATSYVGGGRWKFKCDCGGGKEAHRTDVVRGETWNCGCSRKELVKVSKTEILLGDYIENEYEIKIERSFSVEDRLFDIRYKNLLIESDGKYWHSIGNAATNDKYKNELAIKNGFTLLRFTLNTEKEVKEQWVSVIKPQLDKILLDIDK